MNLSVVPKAPARRRVTGPVTTEHGLTWSVYRVVDDFEVEVSRGDPVIYTDPTLYSTAHKAERAAKAWCEAYVPPAPELSPAIEILHKLKVSGWLVEVYCGTRGGYVADLIDLTTGQAAPSRPTFEEADQALDDARTWADANPTRAELEDRRTAQEMDAQLAGDPPTPFDGPADATTGQNSTLAGPGGASDASPPTPAPSEPDEITTLRARLAATEARLAAALERAPEDAAAEYLELATREAELETQITGTKEILAGLKAELTRVRRSMTKKAVAAMERISGRVPVEQLTIGGVLGTARETGMEIAGHRIELSNGAAYTIEHSIEQSPMGELVTTWVMGAREQTVAYATTYEQAAEDTKRRALEHFADQPAGARVPPVKSTAPKLRGHDKTAVETAVGRTSSTMLAALQLGCTPVQLERYAAAQGVTLKVPALPEAPVEKAGKPRGRRKVGAK